MEYCPGVEVESDLPDGFAEGICARYLKGETLGSAFDGMTRGSVVIAERALFQASHGRRLRTGC
jgi:hypothetical protein